MGANGQYDVAFRQPITERQRLLMLAVLVRDETAFETAKEQLEGRHFGEDAIGHRLIWLVAVSFYEEYGTLPGREELVAELQARVDDDPSLLGDDEIEQLDEDVTFIYDLPQEQLRARVALRYLQRFLHDCLAMDLRSVLRVSNATPETLGEHLTQAVERTYRIDSLQDSPIEEPFPEGWNNVPAVRKMPLNMPWLDDFYSGGDAENEVYGYAAPFGTCKTLLAVQLSAQAARAFASDFEANGRKGPLRLSYHVTYEEPVQMLRVRALSCIGEIVRDYLETGRDEDLSSPGQLKPYEQEMFRFNLDKARCELERRDAAARWLNFNWRIIDFTGQVEGKEHMGAGLVPEITQLIRRDLLRQSKRRQVECLAGKIVIDYAGIACKRYLDARGIPHSQELRHQLGQFPFECKRQLAARFSCPVHIFAQLSGTVAGLSPGVVCQKTDTAENRMFLENCDFGVTIGNMTNDCAAVASLQKARRGKCPKHSVVRINGAMCRIDDTNGDLVYHEKGRRIMSRDEYSQLEGTAARADTPRPDRPVRRLIQRTYEAMR